MAVAPKSYSGIIDCFQKTVLEKGPGQLYRVRGQNSLHRYSPSNCDFIELI